MPVSQPALSSSIDLSGLPVRVLEALTGLAAVCRAPLASEPCVAAFEEAEHRIRESVNALGCEVLGAWIESLDDGALRVERAGQRRFRVAAPAFARAGFAEDDHEHTRPGDLQAGALSPRREPDFVRARGREPGAGERLADAPGRAARTADDGPLHGAGSGRVLLGGGRHDAVSEHLATAGIQPARALGGPRAAGAGEHPRRKGHPARGNQRLGLAPPPSQGQAGVMVALRAGEDGRAEACWREAACGTVSFHDREGERLKTLYLACMPESGKHTLKAQLASEVAHIRQVRPDIAITAVARACPCEGGGSPRQLDLSGEPLARGAGGRLLARLRASPHSLRPCRRSPLVRDLPPYPATRPARQHQSLPPRRRGVIRALRYLRDKAGRNRAAIERELAFFRKNRKRMRYRDLSDRGVAIGSGVVETRDS